jgi:hypothetical protein
MYTGPWGFPHPAKGGAGRKRADRRGNPGALRGPKPIHVPPLPDSNPAMDAVYSPRALRGARFPKLHRGEGLNAELVDGDVVGR